MRTPTEDDRALYAALMEKWSQLDSAARAKRREATGDFRRAHVGQGNGPSIELLEECERLEGLADSERDKLDLLVKDLFR